MSQLALDERWTVAPRPPASSRTLQQPPLCAGCRAREARYGFRDEGRDDPLTDRPRTLCFDCFRAELNRRQAVAARLARGSRSGPPTRTPARWGDNATQVSLPLEKKLEELGRRRCRAQIAARHVLEAS